MPLLQNTVHTIGDRCKNYIAVLLEMAAMANDRKGKVVVGQGIRIYFNKLIYM